VNPSLKGHCRGADHSAMESRPHRYPVYVITKRSQPGKYEKSTLPAPRFSCTRPATPPGCGDRRYAAGRLRCALAHPAQPEAPKVAPAPRLRHPSHRAATATSPSPPRRDASPAHVPRAGLPLATRRGSHRRARRRAAARRGPARPGFVPPARRAAIL